MSKLDELIAELCPDGVEYKPLSEIATITRGGSLQKKDFTESGVPCIHYGQIYTKYGLFTDKTFTFVSETTALRQKKAVTGDIVMAVTSENIEDVCKCVVWLGEGDVAVSGHTAIIHHNQDAKYLAYYFHSSMFFAQKAKLAHGTKVIEVTPDKLNGVIVPVPPLEVQREIVRVLDNFTFLSAELSAELSARRKQYEYYLDYLLTNAQPTQVVKLKDICRFYNGDRGKNYPKVSEMVSEGIPFVNAGDVNGRVDYDRCNKITQEKYESMGGAKLLPGDILYCLRGSTGKNGIYERTGGTVASSLVAIRANERVNYKYLYYLLNSSMEKRQRIRSDTGAAQPNLSAQNVGEFEFPLPSLQEQERIVSILDIFEGISADMRIGLPAEIEARTKQYEYYRDKLLTFKEL